MTAQNEAVEKYRRLESRQKGHDIGWRRASDEWLEKHFPDWAREQRRLIDDALGELALVEAPLNGGA